MQFLFWNRCAKFARNAAEEETLSSSEQNMCNNRVSDKYLICNFALSEEVENFQCDPLSPRRHW